MIRLEKRAMPSQFWQYATPVVAVLATMLAGGVMFALLGKDPVAVIRTIFWDPLFGEFSSYLRGQLLVKAGPLILIALGLSLGFRAGIWNIGAEGQYIIGAICGASVGLAVYPTESRWIFPLMVLAGAFGGWAWAMIPAILKTRFNTNEILVSLMLVYVAETILAKAATGFLRNPEGMGFPGSRNFSSYPAAQNAELLAGTGLHWGGRDGDFAGDCRLYSVAAPYLGLSDQIVGPGPARGAVSRGDPRTVGGFVHGPVGRAGRSGRVVRSHRSSRADQH